MDMSLSVIGSGFGRTGTMSLKHALEVLGLGKCHHMSELYENEWQAPFWKAAARGEQIDWKKLMAGYGACVDWPATHFWRELSMAFPSAKIIHTTRSPESWWASYSETIMKFIEAGTTLPAGIVRDMCEWCVEIIGEQTFGSDISDREAAIAAFNRRLLEVRETIPMERLLIFEVSEGWQPLCDFLDLPVPDTPFPRVNDRSDFWTNFPARA